MHLNKLTTVIFFLLFFSACSSWQITDWNSYKVILEVQDPFGKALSGVKVQSQGKSTTAFTSDNGRLILHFNQSGLHIVTIQSPDWLTKQILIKTPDDVNKVVIVNLKPKSRF